MNRLRRWTAALVALAVGVTAAPGTAKDRTTYTDEEFATYLREAADMAHYKKAVELTARSGAGKLEVVRGIEDLGDSRWRVMVTVYDYEKGSTESIYIKEFPVLIEHLGTGYRSLFMSPEIEPLVLERALQNEYMTKAKEEYRKEHKDVTVEYGVEDDRVTIATAYAYAGGVNDRDIRNRLEALLVASSWIGRMAFVGTRLSRMELQKELQDGKPTRLQAGEVTLMLATDLSCCLETDVGGTDGYWRFSFRERMHELRNHGDHLVISYDRKLPASLSIVESAAVEVAMRAWVEKNRAKGAAAMTVDMHPVREGTVWVTATYPLDGKTKGEKIRAAYHDFRENYSVEAEKEVAQIVKKVSS